MRPGYADGMNQITVRRMQMVTVINRGAQSVIGTYGETTGSLLARMGITPGTGDTLSCSSETQTYDGMTIELVHTETRIEEEDTTVPYPVNYYEDPDLEPDAEIVLPMAGQKRPDPRQERGHLPQRQGGLPCYRAGDGPDEARHPARHPRASTAPSWSSPPIRSLRSRRPLPPRPHGLRSSSSGSSSSGGSRYDGSAETDGNVIMTSSGESYTYVDVMSLLRHSLHLRG